MCTAKGQNINNKKPKLTLNLFIFLHVKACVLPFC